jgi:3-oxoacyl-[acyl-carrier-protein] synthase-3
MNPVYITRLAKYLPNEPVSNGEMESVLGMVAGKPSRARSIVLRNNGIKTRYYAFKEGKPTHTNAQLAAIAIKQLFDDQHPIEDLDLLAAGTSSPEQVLPSHAAMVHGALGVKPIEIVSMSGACASSMQAMKYAYMAVAGGMAHTAAASGSERISSWTQAARFQPEAETWKDIENNPHLAFEKDFLRWMLSDGAGAALLQDHPNKDGISLRIEWIEILSYANELETCMYAGAVKNEDATLTSYNDMDAAEWDARSVFAYKQDTRLLGEHVVPRGGMFMKELMEKHGITGADIDYYLPHMSSEFFKAQIHEWHEKIGLDIPLEKWFYNLTRVGNVGSASAYLMLEELFTSGRLKPGEHILVMVPESARVTYAYLYLTVV